MLIQLLTNSLLSKYPRADVEVDHVDYIKRVSDVTLTLVFACVEEEQ